jgi:UDP-3-O-[3-hydroxymyristoyl] glucosamine N-acyltransferase
MGKMPVFYSYISAMPSFSYTDIAQLTGGTLEPDGADGSITGCASLLFAKPEHLSFCVAKGPEGAGRRTAAGLVLVPLNFENWPGEARAVVRVENPYHAMILCRQSFQEEEAPAVIHPSAAIGPNCVIQKGVRVGEGCVLDASVTLYTGVELGPRNHLHAGVVMGSRGFGFYEYRGERRAVPHFGGVQTGADCEFGPQTVVAAGFLEPTRIGDRCAFDSFVQIAHNCILGNDIVCCSQSGLAGSVTVEDGVTLAGGAQVAGHLTLGKGCTVAAKAGVTKSVTPGITVAGFPARPIREWRREIAERKAN